MKNKLPPSFLYHSLLAPGKNSKESDAFFKVNVFWCFQVRDLSIAYLLVGLTYLYVGVLIFAAFPSPPLFKDCIEPVRSTLQFSHSFLNVGHHAYRL